MDWMITQIASHVGKGDFYLTDFKFKTRFEIVLLTLILTLRSFIFWRAYLRLIMRRFQKFTYKLINGNLKTIL